MDQFKFQSQFPIRKEELFRFHEEPIGFSTLMGANKRIQIIQKPNSLAVGEIAIFKIPIFPFISIQWIAKHTKYEKNILFQDNQEKGPFIKFLHTHRFLDVEGNSNESILSDEIEVNFYFWPISKFFIYPMLYFMFKKRHQLTANYFSIKHKLIFSGYTRSIIN
ncbi:MAG: SRPBCC family protein [Leptospira bouyouniensis]